jgi:hypothetical protein
MSFDGKKCEVKVYSAGTAVHVRFLICWKCYKPNANQQKILSQDNKISNYILCFKMTVSHIS